MSNVLSLEFMKMKHDKFRKAVLDKYLSLEIKRTTETHLPTFEEKKGVMTFSGLLCSLKNIEHESYICSTDLFS